MSLSMFWWSLFGWGIYTSFVFKQETAYEMRISDWSSDVCSSDLTIRRVGICRCRFCTFSDDVANDVDIAAVLYLYAGVSEVPDCTTEDIDVLGTVIRVYSPGHISVTGISSAAQKNSTDDIDCSEANTIQPTGGDKYACR